MHKKRAAGELEIEIMINRQERYRNDNENAPEVKKEINRDRARISNSSATSKVAIYRVVRVRNVASGQKSTEDRMRINREGKIAINAEAKIDINRESKIDINRETKM